MKRVSILLCLFGLISINSQQSISKPYEAQVKGGFNTMTIKEYKYKGNKVDMNSGSLMSTITLDDKGNQILIENYENNKISYKAILKNKYNSMGALSEYTCFDAASKPLFTMKYEYDDKLNKISEIQTKSSGDESISNFYKYDENNFVIEESHQYKSANYEAPQSTTFFKNDKYGNKIEESVDAGMEISAEVSAGKDLSDGKNSKSDASVKSKAIKSANTYKYTYDENGRIVLYILRTHSGYISKHEFKYDKFGNTTEDIYYDEKDKPFSKTVYEYSK